MIMQNSEIRKPKRTKTSRQRWSVLLYILTAVVTVYVLFMIVDQQIKINNAKSELALLEEKVYTQEQTNAELKKVADAVKDNNETAYEGYVEKIAREDLDYVKNGEVVFVNIAGD